MYAAVGCGAIVSLGMLAMVGMFVVALVHQGGNSENGYSCSPGPCALRGHDSIRIKRVTFGDIPASLRDRYSASRYVRFTIEAEASRGAGEALVYPTDFGLVDRQGRAQRAATGFSPCGSWTEASASGSGSTIPAICFAVGDTDITRYRMTWSHLQQGQTIRLYMPT
ncbi:MAG: hypothetical protein ABR573_04895 [Candidatus Dormibacteria bacterium]